jgi:hypothetical protein
MRRTHIHPNAIMIDDLIGYIFFLTDNMNMWETYFIYDNTYVISGNIRTIIKNYELDKVSTITDFDDFQDLEGFEIIL